MSDINIFSKVLVFSFLFLMTSNVSKADWKQTKGPHAGNVRGFAILNDVLYCCTSTGGIFKQVNDVFTPFNKGLIFGTDEFVAITTLSTRLFTAHFTKGIFSSNAISEWEEKNYNGLTTTRARCLLVKESKLFIGTEDCVFMSSDNGDNWNRFSSGIPGSTGVTALCLKGGNIFAGTENGKIYKTTDEGANWTEVKQGLGYVRAMIATGDLIFAAANKINKSSDNGINWAESNNGLGLIPVNAMMEKEGNLFAGTESGLYYSVDNGVNWNPRNLSTQRIYSLFQKINGTVYAGCSGGKIFSSNDDFDVNVTPENGADFISTDPLIASSGKVYAGTKGSGVFRFEEFSEGWLRQHNGLTNYEMNCFAELNGNSIYAGTNSGIIQRTETGPFLLWSQAGNPLEDLGDVRTIINKTGNLFAAHSGSGVYKFDQSNETWSRMGSGMPTQSIFSLTFKEEAIYAGGNQKAFITVNQADWTEISNNLPAGGILTLLTTEQNIYAGTNSNGVYSSLLNPVNWAALNNNIPANTRVNELIRSGKYILAGTDNGIFLMTNENGNWAARNEGFGASVPVVFSLLREGKNIYASTEKGVWYLPVADLSINLKSKATLQGPNTSGQSSSSTDPVKHSFRSSFPPYSKVDSSIAILSELDTGTVISFENANNGSYYLVLTHRNSIETWSSVPLSFTIGSTTNYDFTFAPSRAFGNNMVYVSGDWCIYSGDINQDGLIDASDLAEIDNDAYNFVTGYVVTDITLDNIVDASDAAITDNNASLFVSVIRP